VSAITRLDARVLRVPLTRPWAADVTSVGVIATHVVRSDGAEGWGFSWTPQIGVEAVHAMLVHDIAPAAAGRSATPGAAWQALWEHVHEAGAGGVTTIALAGLDLALWDAEARASGKSVSTLLGRRRDSVRTYGSGVNLHYPLDELVAQVRRWTDAGFSAAKVKVGKPSLEEDIERVAAVREVLGSDRELMIDANQRWDLARATLAIEKLSAFDLAWIEEPLRADDLPGHTELARRLASSSRVPIALGENVHCASLQRIPACRRRPDRAAEHRAGGWDHAAAADRCPRPGARHGCASAPAAGVVRSARARPSRHGGRAVGGGCRGCRLRPPRCTRGSVARDHLRWPAARGASPRPGPSLPSPR
jgi:L-alanine-DL-glutamate epimerase-like enolase superfamily enzyme